MKKAFRSYPIELAACADLRDREKEREFLPIADGILIIFGKLLRKLSGIRATNWIKRTLYWNRLIFVRH